MRKIKILVVDDELAEEIKENLEDFTFQGEDCGVSIETAFSCADAKNKMVQMYENQKQFYDVVIIDMRMENNEEEGLDLLQLNFPSVKIVLTAYAGYANCVKCIKAGADNYINKLDNNSYTKLKEAIREGLEDRLTPPPEIPFLMWANFNMDALIERYGTENGNYIAVISDKVVDTDVQRSKLERRVKENYPFINAEITNLPPKD